MKFRFLPQLFLPILILSSSNRSTQYSYDKDLLTADFHKGRREALRKLMPANSVAIFFSNPICIRSNDVEFDYHQSPNMYYLSGFNEPNSALVIFKDEQDLDSVKTNELLFIRDRDPKAELWTGRIMGVDDARKDLGIKSVYSNTSHFFRQLNWKRYSLITGEALLKSMNGDDPETDGLNRMKDELRPQLGSGVKNLLNTSYYDSLMNILRKVKTYEEMTLLKKAIDISKDAHIEVMKAIQPDMSEYQVQAIMEYEFKMRGAEYEGYPSICGSGENSCTLHYTASRRAFAKNDLIVVDCGAEYHGYSADITRTLPVNGKFSPEQKLIYELVLKAQLAGIEQCKAGNDFHDPYKATALIVAKGLMDLGIIKKTEDYKLYYPHGSSHHIGLDVHDCDYEGTLETNNVITVEPGIYIPAGSDCDPKWWNIGVRIEDDVLITKGAPEVLSGRVPKTVAEVEATIAQPSVHSH